MIKNTGLCRRISKSIRFTLGFLFISTASIAQARNDQKQSKFSKGFTVGIVNSRYAISETNWNSTLYADTLNSVDSKSAYGYDFGFVFSILLNNTFSLQTKFKLGYQNNKIVYDKKAGVETVELSRLFIGIPVHLLIKPGKSSKFYGILGPSFKFNLDDEKNKVNPVEINNFDFSADLGIGREFRLKNFILAPELIFSKGLSDNKVSKNNLQSNVIKSLKSHEIYLQVNLRSK